MMKRLLIILIALLSVASLNAQTFVEDWKKASVNTFKRDKNQLKIFYKLKDRNTGSIVENSSVDMTRVGNQVYANSFNTESLYSGKYYIIVDNKDAVISVFRTDQSKEAKDFLANDKFMEELTNFTQNYKITAAKADPKEPDVRTYLINKPSKAIEKVSIAIDTKQNLVKKISYYYAPIADGSQTQNFSMEVTFQHTPVQSFSYSLSKYVDIQAKKVILRPKYSKYRVINHL